MNNTDGFPLCLIVKRGWSPRMAGITQTAQEKFANLRKRLDQLGYKQPLGLDCLPLVERLFCDLVWTTESLRKTKLDLNSQLKLRSAVEDYVAPYKTDNGRLMKENNELHRQLLNARQDHDDKLRGIYLSECGS